MIIRCCQGRLFFFTLVLITVLAECIHAIYPAGNSKRNRAMTIPVVVTWVLQRTVVAAAGRVGQAILQNAWAYHSEMQAFHALKSLFAAAAQSRPDFCKPQELNVACPGLEYRARAYNPKAHGTDTFNMYQFIRESAGYIVVIFHDLSPREISVLEYDRGWTLFDSHVVLPSEALAEVKRVVQGNVFPASS